MAAKKPIKFKRMADAFEEVWKTKSQPCVDSSSSGSDHWPSGSLSDLVNSFIQNVDDLGDEVTQPPPDGDQERDRNRDGEKSDDSDNSEGDDGRKELLMRLVGCGDGEDDDVVGFRRKIIEEIEFGFQDQIMSWRDLGFKRGLMLYLRERGYDAGLCKSRWEKTSRYPAGNYEYVDIISGASSRYIVEVLPAGRFEIARPTDRYTALLQAFPPIFIGKPESLKQIVRLMSAAMKESLKSSALQVAPWRRHGYLQAMWFAQYKRTTGAAPARITGAVEGSVAPAKNKRRSVVGFEKELNWPAKAIVYNCSREFGSKAAVRTGLLAAAFQGK